MGTTQRSGENGYHTHDHDDRTAQMLKRGRRGVVDDNLNVPLEDAELLAEVELTTNLIIAASESESGLSQDEVDRLLGVEPGGPQIPPQQRREE